MRTIRYIAALSVFAMAPVTVLSAEDAPGPNESPWRIVLEGQLKAEQACDLNEVLAYQEIPLGGDVGVDGRVSCFDGREFNFSRQGKHRKFSIQICAPAVC